MLWAFVSLRSLMVTTALLCSLVPSVLRSQSSWPSWWPSRVGWSSCMPRARSLLASSVLRVLRRVLMLFQVMQGKGMRVLLCVAIRVTVLTLGLGMVAECMQVLVGFMPVQGLVYEVELVREGVRQGRQERRVPDLQVLGMLVVGSQGRLLFVSALVGPSAFCCSDCTSAWLGTVLCWEGEGTG